MEHWKEFEDKIKSVIEPLLERYGYKYQNGDITENEGYYIQYETEKNASIGIHILKNYSISKLAAINWVRVYIGWQKLKPLVHLSSQEDLIHDHQLYDGWIYTNDEALAGILEEIKYAFEIYFKRING